jgi:hypothetical protein
MAGYAHGPIVRFQTLAFPRASCMAWVRRNSPSLDFHTVKGEVAVPLSQDGLH